MNGPILYHAIDACTFNAAQLRCQHITAVRVTLQHHVKHTEERSIPLGITQASYFVGMVLR